MNQIKNYTLPVLVLLSGIFLSTISAYYSILGLVSIFSGSVLLTTLMGISLEVGKISACLWLHKHWKDKIGFLKLYLSVAIIILMVITSLGIYGFLTKANLKQSEGVNLNLAKVSALESNINREQSRLDLNSTQIAQYNVLLTKLTTQDVRRASNERRRIQSEIKVLAKESKEIAKTVDNLNTELLPYKSEINAVEVEVGTLLYISKLIYGDDYKEYLPQTLTVLTLLIIFVFDPLAIGLLIASQKSFRLITEKEVKPMHKNEYADINGSGDKYEKIFKGIHESSIKLKSETTRGGFIPININGIDVYGEFKEPSDIKFKTYLDDIDKELNEEVKIDSETPNILINLDDSVGVNGELNLKNIDDINLELNSIVNNHEPLGEEFDKVLDDNRWELYEESEPSVEESSLQEQSRLPKRRRQNSRKI